MDPFNAIGTIIAVLQLTATVVKYLNDVKNASKDQKRCAIEASNLLALLTKLKCCLEESASTDPLHARARQLATKNGILDQYKAALELLITKVKPEGGAGKVTAAILWSFNKKETEEILGTIERLKSLLLIDFQIDHFKLSQAIKEETRLISSAVQHSQDNELSEVIVNWLSPIDFFARQTDLTSQQQEGTGIWFLESPEFSDWVKGVNTTLFCPGIPGAGKTMISSLVINHLRKTSDRHGVGVVFLYCNYKEDKERKVVNLLSALLKQLVQELPYTPAIVQALYETHKDRKTQPSLSDISTTIRHVLEDYREVFIVVDALDECPDEYRDNLLSELKNLQVPRVRLMVTSRPISTISTRFRGALQLPIKAYGEDIKRLVEGQIPRLARCVSHNPELKQRVILAIHDAVVADGIFLLAQLLLDSLVNKLTSKAVESALEFLPRGSEALSQTYRDAVERISSQAPGHSHLAKTALSWIIYAKRPLRVEELQHALATETGERELGKDNITHIDDIVSACAGLVTIDGRSDVIRLIHYTAQEYFEKTWSSIFPAAQEYVAMTCISYIYFDAFETGCCLDEKRSKSYTFYNYAAVNWGYHARATSVEEGELILKFLKNDAKVRASWEAILVSLSRRYSPRLVPRQVTGMHLAAYFGLKDTITALLKIGHDPHPQDTNRRSPLVYAARNGFGRTLLSYAAEKGHETIVKLLLARDNIDPDSMDNRRRTPLLHAAKCGHEAVAKLLLANINVKPDSTNFDGRTPLSYAAENGHRAIVELLLAEDRVNPNSEDKDNYTPLLYASQSHKEVVKLLLEKKGVEPNAKNKDGRTPLILATRNKQKAIVKLLLGIKSVELNSQDKEEMTPLSYAAQRGYSAIVNLLLENPKVDPNLTDRGGRTPLSWAVAGNKLWGMSQHEHATIAQVLLADTRIDPDYKDSDGRTPLSHAAEQGNEEIVKLLLTNDHIDPNSNDEFGRTPLAHAASRGGLKVVQLLLSEDRVNPNFKDANGRTPLAHAASYGSIEVIQLLLADDRIDPDSRDANGRTPLVHAANRGSIEVNQLLLADDRIDPDSRDANGRTPLVHAANRGSIEVVQLLLADDRIDPEARDANGRTPLSHAAEQRNEEIVKLLLTDNRIDPDSQDSNSRTPLSHAAEMTPDREAGEVVKLLLADTRINPDSKDSSGWTPLSYAVENQNCDKVVKLLLAHSRIDLNSEDAGGRAPLSHAVEKGCLEVVKLFLASGRVDPHCATIHNHSLSSWAAENWYNGIVAVLTEGDVGFPDLRGNWASILSIEEMRYTGFAEVLFMNSTYPCKQNRSPLSSTVGSWHEVVLRLLVANKHSGKSSETEMWCKGMIKLLLTNDSSNLNFRDASGRTLLWWIARNGYEAAAQLLLETEGVEPEATDENGRTPLFCAAIYGKDMIVRLLLARKDVNPDCRDKFGLTPLLLAVWRGNEAVAKLLLADNRIDPNFKDPRYGMTPLSLAASKGYSVVVKLLVAHGKVDLNSRDCHGPTPLLQAAERGHDQGVKLLLEKYNANANSRNEFGITPLFIAAWGGHTAVVKLLLAGDNVDPNSRDSRYGMTPLLMASMEGHELVVKVLLAEKGVNLASRNNYNQTPLWVAAFKGHQDIVRLLLARNGDDLNTQDIKYGISPLSAAASNGHTAAIELLLAQYGIDIDTEGVHNGRTPLSLAAENGRTAVVELLLAQDGIDINHKSTKYGLTPLFLAAKNGHVAAVKLLLQKGGVDMDSRDAEGLTALSWAVRNEQWEMVDLLASYSTKFPGGVI